MAPHQGLRLLAVPRDSYGYAIGEVASSLPVGVDLLENLI
jgi:hypothetical protein